METLDYIKKYENLEDSFYKLFERLPIIPKDEIREIDIAFELFPYVDGISEVVVDSHGQIALALGYDESDEEYWNKEEYDLYRGNLINTALDVICKRIGFDKPFWSLENQKKIDSLSDDPLSIGINNLYRVLNHLLAWDNKIDLDVFYSMLEDSIPHTSILRKLNEKFSISWFRSNKEEHPIYCLFDVIYLSLRSNVIESRSIHLKECTRCHRLYYANHSSRQICLLDTPGETCVDRDTKERANLNSQTAKTFRQIQRLIEAESDNIDSRGNNLDEVTFRKDFRNVAKPAIEKMFDNPRDRYSKRLEYLNDFKNRYNSEVPIEDLIEESKREVGIER